MQRTICDISDLFIPLEAAIRHKFIPALLGREVSDIERRIFSLPLRYGGLGISNPVLSADKEYEISIKITAPLSALILSQSTDVDELDEELALRLAKEVKDMKEAAFKEEQLEIFQKVDSMKKRAIELCMEKGASCYLSALPLKKFGYQLNKQEFRDSLCLRYNLPISHVPSHCACGANNDICHTLTCMKGGYVVMRHNKLRDVEASLLEDICRDVRVEPRLIPVDGQDPDCSKLDVSAVGLWSSFERTFLDIRVMHPFSKSYVDKPVATLYSQHEKEKKGKYLKRVLDVEKGSFSPVVFSTFGGCGPEADNLHKRMALLLSKKKKESYNDVLCHIRTRLSFALLKSVLISLRGVRGKQKEDNVGVNEISFNLIPAISADGD